MGEDYAKDVRDALLSARENVKEADAALDNLERERDELRQKLQEAEARVKALEEAEERLEGELAELNGILETLHSAVLAHQGKTAPR